MTTGWAGVKPSPKTAARHFKKSQAWELARYFVGSVDLAPGYEHRLEQAVKVVSGLLEQYPYADVRGMLEDAVFISQEVIAGRLSQVQIRSAGILPYWMDSYDPETKKIGKIWGRDYQDDFDGQDLVVVG